ncbi:GntR family transcriptional regulator [Ornithinibacillus contaminans]|uniref:GntR family transcriptional regulator n=1 Tax=Ornithinibacillus contaminans TaxID=694055 RepID=UPI00064D7B0F|nr:GntR family transcriptional regulator [Ornithinibacillus contaminans]
MIDKQSPIPIYYQLEEEIKSMIHHKQLKPGDLLPSEREYAEKYAISRMTVRQAISNLVKEGLIYRQKGKGTFVADKKIEQDLSGLTSFSEDMRNRGLIPSNQLISFDFIPATEQLADILMIASGDMICKIKRVRLADEEPVALETVYTPQNVIGDMNYQDFSESFYDYVEKKLHFKIGFGHQTIEAALASDEERAHLHIQKGSPVLVMQRTTYLQDEQQTPIEYVTSTYRADKYKFKMKMKRD